MCVGPCYTRERYLARRAHDAVGEIVAEESTDLFYRWLNSNELLLRYRGYYAQPPYLNLSRD